ncbi:hypothetical protein OC842_007024, partial [Tilletia horrida]
RPAATSRLCRLAFGSTCGLPRQSQSPVEQQNSTSSRSGKRKTATATSRSKSGPWIPPGPRSTTGPASSSSSPTRQKRRCGSLSERHSPCCWSPPRADTAALIGAPPWRFGPLLN